MIMLHLDLVNIWEVYIVNLGKMRLTSIMRQVPIHNWTPSYN